MKPDSHKAKRRAARIAGLRRQAVKLGFQAEVHEADGSIRLVGQYGLAFRIYPFQGTWYREGTHSARDRQGGGLERLFSAYEAERRRISRLDKARPDVTIFADASLSDRTRSSGWGAWMKGEGLPAYSVGGAFSEWPGGSTEGEMRALANALAAAKAKGYLRAGATVLLQCDCLHPLQAILTGYPESRDRPAEGGLTVKGFRSETPAMRASKGLKALLATAHSLRLTLLTRHVPGHREGEGRAYVNRLCDELARRHARPATETAADAP